MPKLSADVIEKIQRLSGNFLKDFPEFINKIATNEFAEKLLKCKDYPQVEIMLNKYFENYEYWGEFTERFLVIYALIEAKNQLPQNEIQKPKNEIQKPQNQRPKIEILNKYGKIEDGLLNRVIYYYASKEILPYWIGEIKEYWKREISTDKYKKILKMHSAKESKIPKFYYDGVPIFENGYHIVAKPDRHYRYFAIKLEIQTMNNELENKIKEVNTAIYKLVEKFAYGLTNASFDSLLEIEAKQTEYDVLKEKMAKSYVMFYDMFFKYPEKPNVKGCLGCCMERE